MSCLWSCTGLPQTWRKGLPSHPKTPCSSSWWSPRLMTKHPVPTVILLWVGMMDFVLCNTVICNCFDYMYTVIRSTCVLYQKRLHFTDLCRTLGFFVTWYVVPGWLRVMQGWRSCQGETVPSQWGLYSPWLLLQYWYYIHFFRTARAAAHPSYYLINSLRTAIRVTHLAYY